MRMNPATIGQPHDDRDGAAVEPGSAEAREAARQDRDDRERDGEVRERTPGALELLLVAELGQPFLVSAELPLITHPASFGLEQSVDTTDPVQ